MQIVYTAHARQRMAKRRITEQDVRWVLSEPDDIEIYNGEAMAIRRGSNRLLKVIYYQVSDDTFRIITVIAQRIR